MIIKSIVVIDGKEVEIKDLKDPQKFANEVNKRVLLGLGYVVEKNERRTR